jgi:hypothetical protein
MNKVVYFLWARPKQHPDALLDALLDVAATELVQNGARGMAVHARDSEARVRSPSPGFTGRKAFDAMVSLWFDDDDARYACERILRQHCARLAGYRVDESVYTDYGENRHGAPRDWPDGERSPGVVAVSLLEQPAGMPYHTWIQRWHGRQSPLSELMQPRTRYVRNVVRHSLNMDAADYGGIVEEAWPSRRHVEDPYLFYGAQTLPVLAENMRTMLQSVTNFLELPRIQTVMTSEYFVVTPCLKR